MISRTIGGGEFILIFFKGRVRSLASIFSIRAAFGIGVGWTGSNGHNPIGVICFYLLSVCSSAVGHGIEVSRLCIPTYL
ncbi:hypothetical protein M426DRAFT_116287 [Hypoxylon sp. CI-4A]|nr:hypothetical protein M426DRAFT_116287 [Hypoxylon sp. CI-4A]